MLSLQVIKRSRHPRTDASWCLERNFCINFKNIIKWKNRKTHRSRSDSPPEVGVGVYANLALITHSNTDFVLDFACILPGLGQPQVRSRVIMAPEHAKRLLQALQENVYKYEQTFGKIEIPNQQERTIAPFNVKGNGGEA